MSPLKTPKQRERERKRLFRPYANELGWLLYEWNRLKNHWLNYSLML